LSAVNRGQSEDYGIFRHNPDSYWGLGTLAPAVDLSKVIGGTPRAVWRLQHI